MTERDYFVSECSEAEVRALNSLALAHVGDGVFELLVRLHTCRSSARRSGGLHQATIALVNAGAQAAAMRRLLPLLTEEELQVYHRGRNAKVNSVPRHAQVGDYHAATGLEALFGYLYLLGRRERLNLLFAHVLEDENAT